MKFEHCLGKIAYVTIVLETIITVFKNRLFIYSCVDLMPKGIYEDFNPLFREIVFQHFDNKAI